MTVNLMSETKIAENNKKKTENSFQSYSLQKGRSLKSSISGGTSSMPLEGTAP